jgi:hypothetical protein
MACVPSHAGYLMGAAQHGERLSSNGQRVQRLLVSASASLRSSADWLAIFPGAFGIDL